MGPLNGIKVLEFSGIGPGPFCGMILADLGADVIRLSKDTQKGYGNVKDVHNRSKKTITADLKNPKVVEEIKKLIQQMDVVFEGFRPGVMEKLGIGPEECLKINPKLIYGRMTGWGQEGPLSKTAGHDINYISIAGVLNSIGRRDSNPIAPLNLIGDYGGGGMHLAVGILSAYINRLKTGEGQIIDSAMVDGSLSLMSFFYSLKQMDHWKNDRESNLLDGAAHFYDTYECADNKFIAVGCLEQEFYEIFLTKLEINNKKFHDRMNIALWEELKEIISKKIKSKTRNQWEEIFKNTDACVSPVLDMDEAIKHPHNSSRDAFIEIDNFIQPNASPRFSNTPLKIKHNAKIIGSDNDSVCSEYQLDKNLFS